MFMDFQLGTLLFQVVVFLVLLVLIRKYAMGPAMSVLEKRREQIENQILTAERSRSEAEALLEEQRKVLKEARDEAYLLVERAKKQSEIEAKEILDTAKQRSDRMVEEARTEITREKDKAVAELRNQVASLSVLLASKIIEKELSDREQQETIEQFMKQVGDRL